MQDDCVYRVQKMEEEELLSLHKHATLSQTAGLREAGVSGEEFLERQREIQNRKMNTSDQYVVNRIDMMSSKARRKYRDKEDSLAVFIRVNRTHQQLEETAGERINSRMRTLGLKTLSSSQIGKRKQKMEQKHRVFIGINNADFSYQKKKRTALIDFMKEDYERILKSSDGASRTYLTEVKKENEYFEELSDYATWMAYEREQGHRRAWTKDREFKDFHKLLNSANSSPDRDDAGAQREVRSDRQAMLEIYEKHIMDETDLSGFDYHSTEEFLSRYQENYPKLKALMAADRLLGDMEKAGEKYASPGNRDKVFRVKLETLKEIYEDYTARKKILGSDCYVLLAKKDIAGKSLKEVERYRRRMLDAGFAGKTMSEYLDGLMVLKSGTGFKMGSSAGSIYEEKKKQAVKAEYEETKREFTALVKGMGFKSADKAVDADPVNWMNRFRDHIFRGAQIDESKTFAGLYQESTTVFLAESILKEKDAEYDRLYQYWASKEKLDKLGDLFSPEVGSLCSKKEKEVFERLKNMIDNARETMSRDYAMIEQKYRNDVRQVFG